MWVNAKGPWRRAHPAGPVTTEVANSLRIARKWGPWRPREFIAKGMRRVVAKEATRRLNLMSLVNFAFSTIRREKSELCALLDKHDFASAETMPKSIAVSFRYTPFPRATTSLG